MSPDIDPQILASFVAAMSSFMGQMLGLPLSEWQVSYGSDSTLVVERGEWVFGVLVVSRATDELRSKLRQIVREFETTFATLKGVDGLSSDIFSEFDHYVRRVFLDDRLSERSVIVEKQSTDVNRLGYDSPMKKFLALKLLIAGQPGMTLKELATFNRVETSFVLDVFSRAVWTGQVRLAFVPDVDDLLFPTESTLEYLFSSSNPLGLSSSTLTALGLMDGRLTLTEVIQEVGSSYADEVFLQLGNLLRDGYLQKASAERILVFSMECVLSSILRSFQSKHERTRSLKLFKSARLAASTTHPWASRVELDSDQMVRCRLSPSASPSVLDAVYSSLEAILEHLKNRLKRYYSAGALEQLVEIAVQSCSKNWLRYIRSSTL
ncbi:MAG: hypothetical protein QXS20_10850 [Candidatus Thorarchaeota archaeon]